MNDKYVEEVEWLFKKYGERALQYCILRGHEYLPVVEGHDIDLIVLKKDWRIHKEIIFELMKLYDLRLDKKVLMPYARRFYFKKRLVPNTQELILDYHFDEEWMGAIFLEFQDIPKVNYKGYIVAEQYVQPILPFITFLLSTSGINEKYFERLIERTKTYSDEMRAIFQIAFGRKLGDALWQNICTMKRENISTLTGELRRRVWLNSFKKEPLGTPKRFFELVLKLIWHKKILQNYPP